MDNSKEMDAKDQESIPITDTVKRPDGVQQPELRGGSTFFSSNSMSFSSCSNNNGNSSHISISGPGGQSIFMSGPQGSSTIIVNGQNINSNSPGEAYNMNHARRGRCFIFNNLNSDPKQILRQAAAQDTRALQDTFRQLGFEIMTYVDQTASSILHILNTGE